MPKTFKDFMSELATDTSEDNKYSAEDIKAVVDEVTAKDTEIEELKKALEKANKDHEDLKSRIVEKLFSSNDGKPNESDESKDVKPEEKPVVKSFDDLVQADYRIRN